MNGHRQAALAGPFRADNIHYVPRTRNRGLGFAVKEKAAISFGKSTVGWEPRVDPKIIEKIDEFARDMSAFVAGLY